MPVQVGEGSGQYNTVNHIVNGEPASQTVFRRPAINLQNRADAIRSFVNTLESRYLAHNHTSNGIAEAGQLTRAALSDVNVASGMCGLDSNAKVPVAQLPSGVLGDVKYQGTWNANTNVSPTISTGSADPNPSTGNMGNYYVVSVAGATPVDGISDWQVGDWIISNGVVWQKVDNTTEARLATVVNFVLTGKAGWTVGVNGPGTDLALIDTPTQNTSFQTQITNNDTDIATLQGQYTAVLATLTDLLSNTPTEETFTVGVGGQSLFTLGSFSFSATHTNLDIQVFINGDRQIQSTTGALNKDFRKVGTTQIEMASTIPQDAIVTVFKAGVSSGSGIGDFSNVAVNLEPILNTLTIGSVAKPWRSVFIKDKTSNQVYEMEVSGGLFQVTLVP